MKVISVLFLTLLTVGTPSHAGATVMSRRADASLAASRFSLEVNRIANDLALFDESIVATVCSS